MTPAVTWMYAAAIAHLLDGQHVVPAPLQREGFVFRFAGLEAALRDLVER
ncbi:DUF1731 domain-containing protein [Burkholderia gladioli]